jgi:hypothetical protein
MPTAEQQPFHHQMPGLNGGGPPPDPVYGHSRHQSFAQPTVGTPLSNIPERAIHAQPFQPFPQGAPQYPNPYQGGYFYPPQYQSNAAVIAPMYIQGNAQTQQQNQGGYLIPTITPAQQGAPLPSQMQAGQMAQGQMQASMGPGATSSGMVAHEQNGMVYYYDPNQLYTQQLQQPPQSGENPYAVQQHQPQHSHQHQPQPQPQQQQQQGPLSQHQHQQPQHGHQNSLSGGYGMMGDPSAYFYGQSAMYYPGQ